MGPIGARSGFLGLTALLALSLPAAAQDVCVRLESQLAHLEADEGRSSARVFRYDRRLADQHRLLDQRIRQSRQMGCGHDDGQGFLPYHSRQAAMCEAIDDDIARLQSSISRLAVIGAPMPRRAGASDRARRQILGAMASHGCGVQYGRHDRRQIAATGFAAPGYSTAPYSTAPYSGGGFSGGGYAGLGSMSGTFRTMCVRTCDGYAWPVSFSAVSAQFGDDERTCRAACPAAPVELFVHRNPGEEGLEDAVSLSGAPYTALPNAFRHQREVVEGCGCRAADGLAVRSPDAATDQPAAQPERPAPPPSAEQDAARDDGPSAEPRQPRRDVRVVGPGFTYYRSIEE